MGFTRNCGQGHKSGTFTVWRITAKKRMIAKRKAIKGRASTPDASSHGQKSVRGRKVVLGHSQYNAAPGNDSVRVFKLRVCRHWQNVPVCRGQHANMRREQLTPVL